MGHCPSIDLRLMAISNGESFASTSTLTIDTSTKTQKIRFGYDLSYRMLTVELWFSTLGTTNYQD